MMIMMMMMMMTINNQNLFGVLVFMVGDETKTHPSASYLMLMTSTHARVSKSFWQYSVKLGEFVVCAAE